MGIQTFNHELFGEIRTIPQKAVQEHVDAEDVLVLPQIRMKRCMVWTPAGVDYLNLAVRKLPREISANVQLSFNF